VAWSNVQAAKWLSGNNNSGCKCPYLVHNTLDYMRHCFQSLNRMLLPAGNTPLKGVLKRAPVKRVLNRTLGVRFNRSQICSLIGSPLLRCSIPAITTGQCAILYELFTVRNIITRQPLYHYSLIHKLMSFCTRCG